MLFQQFPLYFFQHSKKSTIFPFKTRNVEDLEPEDELLPACEPYYQQVHFGVRQSQVKIKKRKPTQRVIAHTRERHPLDQGSGVWNTNSPYLAIAIVVFIVGAVAAVTSVRYRHYGVYLTHESAGVLSGEQARKRTQIGFPIQTGNDFLRRKRNRMTTPAPEAGATAGREGRQRRTQPAKRCGGGKMKNCFEIQIE